MSQPRVAAFFLAVGFAAFGSATAMAGTSSPLAWDQAPHAVSEAFARARIIGDGYTAISDLRQTEAGWTAHAMESGKPVSLVVTNLGTVDKT